MPSRLRAAAIFPLLAAAWIFAKSPEDFIGPASPQTPPSAAGQKAPAKTPPPTAATAAKPPPAKPLPAKVVMDTATLHSIYLDGDFDQAIKTMEGALKNKRTPLTHADSVFIFKHLGVMYAATPATREKGRYYMAQLIFIEPTAKILDMYASDMIYLIFRNVQEEFENKHPNVAKPAAVAVDTTTRPETAPEPVPAAPVARQRSPRKTAYWITGGAVVAVGAIGLVYILLDNPKPKQHDIVLTE
jgi:hypothetical protein